MRLAVGLARRAVAFASRYRLRELQLLAAPCCIALLAAWVPLMGSLGPGPTHTVAALGFCLLAVACTAALTAVAPWADQHLWPVAALLLALRLAAGASVAGVVDAGPDDQLAWVTQALGLPGTAAVVSLYAVLATRGMRVAMLQAGGRAYVAAAITGVLSVQAALALAPHVGLPYGLPAVLSELLVPPAPFLEGGWPALAFDGVLLALLLRLSSDARGSPTAAQTPAAHPTGGGAKVQSLQRVGLAMLGVFLVLLLVAGWRAVTDTTGASDLLIGGG